MLGKNATHANVFVNKIVLILFLQNMIGLMSLTWVEVYRFTVGVIKTKILREQLQNRNVIE